MGQVFPPFEIRNGDAARIQEDIRNYVYATPIQPLFGAGCRRTIGGFGQNLTVDAIAILEGDLVFESGGDEGVTKGIPNRNGGGERLGAPGGLDGTRGPLGNVLFFYWCFLPG